LHLDLLAVVVLNTAKDKSSLLECQIGVFNSPYKVNGVFKRVVDVADVEFTCKVCVDPVHSETGVKVDY